MCTYVVTVRSDEPNIDWEILIRRNSSALAFHSQRVQLGLKVHHWCRIRHSNDQCWWKDCEGSNMGYWWAIFHLGLKKRSTCHLRLRIIAIIRIYLHYPSWTGALSSNHICVSGIRELLFWSFNVDCGFAVTTVVLSALSLCTILRNRRLTQTYNDGWRNCEIMLTLTLSSCWLETRAIWSIWGLSQRTKRKALLVCLGLHYTFHSEELINRFKLRTDSHSSKLLLWTRQM